MNFKLEKELLDPDEVLRCIHQYDHWISKIVTRNNLFLTYVNKNGKDQLPPSIYTDVFRVQAFSLEQAVRLFGMNCKYSKNTCIRDEPYITNQTEQLQAREGGYFIYCFNLTFDTSTYGEAKSTGPVYLMVPSDELRNDAGSSSFVAFYPTPDRFVGEEAINNDTYNYYIGLIEEILRYFHKLHFMDEVEQNRLKGVEEFRRIQL